MTQNIFFISIFLIFAQISTAFADKNSNKYTCPKIKRQASQLKWKCLEEASDELRYKAQLMSQALLEQVDKIEAQLGEQQDVFIIARAGSSLSGFDQLKSHNKKGKRIYLDEVFNYGVKQMPNKSIDKDNYDRWAERASIVIGDYDTAIHNSRRKITKKYKNKKRPKLIYSHAGILFRTQEGVWNIYHELMPCNEKKKAYLFQDSAMSGTSSFFVDKPHKYTGLILPIKKSLQKRILQTLDNHEEFMARGPVYNAMANPFGVDTANSNSFVLEMIELGRLPQEKYNKLAIKYKKGRDAYNKFLRKKRKELGVKHLSVKQKERIEKKDREYKKVCRPDYPIRKETVKSYTRNGYMPTKIVFDTSFNFKSGVGKFWKESLEMLKVSLIPIVGEHMRPNRATYGDHMKLGIGEAVSVYSIWQYLKRSKLIHPDADRRLFEIPELNYRTAKRLAPVVEGNISLFVEEKRQRAEFKKFDKVLRKMRENR